MEVPKQLAQFVARDLVFLVGGGAVVTSFLFKYHKLPGAETPGTYYILALAISYVIGFTVQEVFRFLGVVTTDNVYKPTRLLRRLFHRYDGRRWPDLSQWCTDDTALRRKVAAQRLDDRWSMHHQRIIMHMMLGATIAPCALVSAALLVVAWREVNTPFAEALFVSALVISLLLWPVGWLKAMQMTLHEVELERCGAGPPNPALHLPGAASSE